MAFKLSRSSTAVAMRSIIAMEVAAGCMAGNHREWHSVMVHIHSACSIWRR